MVWEFVQLFLGNDFSLRQIFFLCKSSWWIFLNVTSDMFLSWNWMCFLPLMLVSLQPVLLHLWELHPPQEAAAAPSSSVSHFIPPCFHHSGGHRQLLPVPRNQGKARPLWPGDAPQLPPAHAHRLGARPARDGGPARPRPGGFGSGELRLPRSDEPPRQRRSRFHAGLRGFGALSRREQSRADQPVGGRAAGAAGEDRNLPEPAERGSGPESWDPEQPGARENWTAAQGRRSGRRERQTQNTNVQHQQNRFQSAQTPRAGPDEPAPNPEQSADGESDPTGRKRNSGARKKQPVKHSQHFRQRQSQPAEAGRLVNGREDWTIAQLHQSGAESSRWKHHHPNTRHFQPGQAEGQPVPRSERSGEDKGQPAQYERREMSGGKWAVVKWAANRSVFWRSRGKMVRISKLTFARCYMSRYVCFLRSKPST